MPNLFGNLFIAKYSASGQLIWARAQSSGGGSGECITADNSGHFYLGGYAKDLSFNNVTVPSRPGLQAYVYKFDTSGTALWVQTIGGYNGNGDVFNSVQPDNAGSVYVCGGYQDAPYVVFDGDSFFNNSGSVKMILARYTDNGQPVWMRTILQSCNIQDLAVCNEHLYFVCENGGYLDYYGDTLSPTVLNSPFLSLLKTDTTGDFICWTGLWSSTRSTLCANPEKSAVYFSTNPSDEIIMGTDTFDNPLNFYYSVVGKFSCDSVSTVGIAAFESEENELSLYPNPADCMINVSLRNKGTAIVKIGVYNLSGQLVSSEAFFRENEPLQLNVESIPPGMYMVRVQTEESIFTGRIIKY
jgi:hypothetical protein